MQPWIERRVTPRQLGIESKLVSNLSGLAWLIPFFPLLGAAIAVLGPKRVRERCSHSGGRGDRFGVSGLARATRWPLLPTKTVFVMRWLTVSELEVPIEFRIDGLTTMMLSMVTFVSTLVAIFAAGYMAGDPGYPRFFAMIGLFVTSMTGLVLSNNYLLTYVFWEGVGVCSYLLVGFWHTRPKAAAAAMKAFLVNRIGDFGFAIAIFWMWSIVPNHDLSYGNVLSERPSRFAARRGDHGDRACCSSGRRLPRAPQIPLYVWLPDAMEGPTPVSAFIHAATMVTAGVYLIARSMPLFTMAPGVARACFGDRLRNRLACGIHRRDPERPEAGDGVFDGEPARVHVHGAGMRDRKSGTARRRGGDVSPVHPCVFQGTVVPGLGQRDARHGRRDRHAAISRLAPPAALHLRTFAVGGLRFRRSFPFPGSSARMKS